MNKPFRAFSSIVRAAAFGIALSFAPSSAVAETIAAPTFVIEEAGGADTRFDADAPASPVDYLAKKSSGHDHCHHLFRDVQPASLANFRVGDEPAPLFHAPAIAVHIISMADSSPVSVRDPVPNLPRYILFGNYRS